MSYATNPRDTGRTKAASRALASVGQADKERLLLCMADSLLAHEGDILAANARDMAASAGVITPVMADRLLLTDKRIAGMAQGVRDVAHLPDPVGEVLSEITRPNGMVIRKVRVPFGLIAIIYESRPNVSIRRSGTGTPERECLRPALRQGGARHLPCGHGGTQGGHCGGGNPRRIAGLHQPAGGYQPGERNRADDGGRAGRSADSARRCGTDPRLRGERNGSLHPDRNRNLPCVC